MREIKFRAWDVVINRMLPSSSIWKINLYSCEHKENLRLMQYTGLKDKNGVEIYEGDIVKGVGEHIGQSHVFYGYGQWFPFSYLGSFNGDDYEVIGNIYEREELIK